MILQTDPADYELALRVSRSSPCSRTILMNLNQPTRYCFEHEWNCSADDATSEEESLALHLDECEQRLLQPPKCVKRAQLGLQTNHATSSHRLVRECYVDLGEQVNQKPTGFIDFYHRDLLKPCSYRSTQVDPISRRSIVTNTHNCGHHLSRGGS